MADVPSGLVERMGAELEQLALRQVLDAMDSSVVLVANRDGLPIVYVNAAFEQTTGWQATDVVGQNCRVLQGHLPNAAARATFRAAIAEARSETVLVHNERPDRTHFWNEVVLSPVWSNGSLTHFLGVQRDVTERVEAQEQIQRLAERDALTGVANRRHLKRWLQRQQNDGEPTALLYVDVDLLKEVNDLLGHSAGDQLLRQLVGRLTAAIRPTDLLARVGGDEFVIAMAPPVDAEGARRAAQRILEATRPPFELGGEPRSVSVSVGSRHQPGRARGAPGRRRWRDVPRQARGRRLLG